MRRQGHRGSAAATHGAGLWPALAVLLLIVLAPTACMLWFLNAAMRNESLAARQRVRDVYGGQAAAAQKALAAACEARLSALERAANSPPAAAFAALVTAGVADAVIIRDRAGTVLYPTGLANQLPDVEAPATMPADDEAQPAEDTVDEPQPVDEPPAWRTARDEEFARLDFGKAAAAYAQLARAATGPADRATALLAQARCLAKAGKRSDAQGVLAELLAAPGMSDAADAGGRLIVPAATLFCLNLIAAPNSPRAEELAGGLARRLNDYTRPMPAPQRLFAMVELRRLVATVPPFPTQQAEELAAEYLTADRPAPEPMRWSPATAGPPPGSGGLWHADVAGGRVIGVWRQGRLVSELQRACRPPQPLAGAELTLVTPRRQTARPFLAVPAAEALPGWTLEVRLTGGDPFSAAAERQKAVYLWTAVLGTAVVLVFALAAAGLIGRQVRLARLKNDLIATVSHELKTPLASMRVLVDTLLAGRCKDARQADEYHRLIAKENERLSRLIDNFLTFSRMERNKVAFDMSEVDVAAVIAAAVEQVQDRFARPGCELKVEVAGGLPPVRADRDALVTVVLNLLDNAYKYTKDDKHVVLRARRDAGGHDVCIEVTDNGLGLTRRQARRIFDRFYQVDQRLTRPAGGCGLGLSIVQFIVAAHGGAVDVVSRPGEGSTFTVRLPAVMRTPGNAVPGL